MLLKVSNVCFFRPMNSQLIGVYCFHNVDRLYRISFQITSTDKNIDQLIFGLDPLEETV